MSLRHSGAWNKTLRQQSKTTPKYDPDNPGSKVRSHGRGKPKSVADLAQITDVTYRDRKKITTGKGWNGKTYRFTLHLSDAQWAAYCLEQWQLKTRGPTITGIDPGQAVTPTGRLVQVESRMYRGHLTPTYVVDVEAVEEAARLTGKSASLIIYDELATLPTDENP